MKRSKQWFRKCNEKKATSIKMFPAHMPGLTETEVQFLIGGYTIFKYSSAIRVI